jgi:excinuclease ABC subunit A
MGPAQGGRTGASCSMGKVGLVLWDLSLSQGPGEKRYKQYIRVFLRQYQLANTCPLCAGSRLTPRRFRCASTARPSRPGRPAVRSIDIHLWLERLELGESDRTIAALILEQLESRIAYLRDVGLGYLSLDRQTRTLSGGEAQRIALANALGSRLVDTLYVLE